MLQRRYTVDNIVQEFNKKDKAKLEKFRQKNCFFCKNKKTNKCEIRKDIEGEYKCIYLEK